MGNWTLSAWPILASAALKSTLVLGVAWIISTLLRRRSAAARHLVWTASAAALLALPLLSLMLPALRVRVANRVRKQACDRDVSAELPSDRQRFDPPADRPGHGIRCERTARWNRAEPALTIQLERGATAGTAACIDSDWCSRGRNDQPEAVSADAVHVRVDNGNRRGRGDHRFDRVAAFAQDRDSGLRRKGVRSNCDTVRGVGRVQHDELIEKV